MPEAPAEWTVVLMPAAFIYALEPEAAVVWFLVVKELVLRGACDRINRLAGPSAFVIVAFLLLLAFLQLLFGRIHAFGDAVLYRRLARADGQSVGYVSEAHP